MVTARFTTFGFAAVLLSLSAAHEEVRPAACAELAQQRLANTTIESAVEDRSGSFAGRGRGGRGAGTPLPPFCRVKGVIKPTPQSEIRFEVWLPIDGWNGKFSSVGNPTWGGSVVTAGGTGQGGGLVGQITRGYATASDNTGHVGTPNDGARFGFGNPERVVDFAYRARHETAVVGKALVQAFYGRPPAHSYFIGSSTGGYQALSEAQRFPDDFDGIVASAPTNNWTGQMAAGVEAVASVHRASLSEPADSLFEKLRRGVLAACDAADGVVDSVLIDPRRCRFDPAQLQCGQSVLSGACLSAAQVAAARTVYRGIVDPRTSTTVFRGLPPGTEPFWSEALDPTAPNIVRVSYWRWLVLGDSTWKWQTFDLASPAGYAAFQKSERELGPIMNAVNPDLSGFRRRGGKLIHIHGWADQRVPATNSIDYYEATRTFFRSSAGSDDVSSFYRLFLAPGQSHSVGDFGAQAALEAWVERGIAPEMLVFADTTPLTDPRRRFVCRFPTLAKHRGSGSTNDAANFVCSDR
jgi:feruloyl esterase